MPGAGQGIRGVGTQGAAAQRGELLGPPHARTEPGGEQHARDRKGGSGHARMVKQRAGREDRRAPPNLSQTPRTYNEGRPEPSVPEVTV
ncbi:hypothetical protein GCM10017781_30870 [Deinococcus metalli]|uniref:Uncharacterized protein n=1 Tax=Deinococcus metalli TaxID=1141878 RepID=A0ABQ3JSF5_9DEIO|nr:hypothetical protein GCM10017781_30870 [Deinococcus metalli]